MPNISTNTLSISSANFLFTKNISTANITHIEAQNNSFKPNQALGNYLKIRFMTIAHVAALYRRNAKRRRKHGVKCKKISFSPFNEWASTNQLKLFFYGEWEC